MDLATLSTALLQYAIGEGSQLDLEPIGVSQERVWEILTGIEDWRTEIAKQKIRGKLKLVDGGLSTERSANY